jgi:transcriptional regulator with XRE-family HTH domain
MCANYSLHTDGLSSVTLWSMNDPWKSQMEALGSFIRTQRKLADLSLRELSEMTEVSNPYLSQLERGLHQPSVRVLKSIANALNLSAETLLVQAGLLEGAPETEEGEAPARSSVEAAIRTDPVLSDDQKEALINVYRAMAHDRRSG